MSNVIDERVVSLKFDNRNFEQNVKTSMSTLDKLKSKFNFSGVGKSINNLADHTNILKKNLDVLGNGARNIGREFSSLQVIGATCLVNLTNSAIHAGKRIVSALTLDPVKTGFEEYETKINAIQTILANTSSKGEDIESVTRVIDTLNTYADKTIYNFSEMTRNIGTFTAAGVGLQDSADAIQGIANLAAMSGSTSQQASTAMYQLSQALAAGTVKLMDWNSVVNAGMGGQKFQDALKATAKEFGTDVDSMIKETGSFRESLSKGWITADVLNTTLKKFTVEGAKEYGKSMVKSKKWTQDQADALLKEAQMAEDAATKVKTLTQLWDTLKETAQSGWGKTWELIFGNFEEAKSFFTDINNKLSPIIDKMSDSRNNLIEGAMGNQWDKLRSQINNAGIETEKFESALRDVVSHDESLRAEFKKSNVTLDDMIEKYGSLSGFMTSEVMSSDIILKVFDKLGVGTKEVSKSTEDLNSKLEDFNKIVNKVWNGDFGNGEERIKKLTAAGYKYEEIQDLVNKTEGKRSLTLEDLSDSQKEMIGLTDDEISLLNELGKEASATGTPLNELINNMYKKSGRELILESIMNTINGIIKVVSTLKNAWRDVFNPITSDQVYGVLESINKLSYNLILNDKNAKKLKVTFQGLFTALKLIGKFTGGTVKIVFNILNTILKSMDLNILDVTSAIGSAIIKFDEWVSKHNYLGIAVEKIVPIMTKAIAKVKDYINSNDTLKQVLSDLANIFKRVGNHIYEWLMNINVSTGILSTLKNNIAKVIDKIAEWIHRLRTADNITEFFFGTIRSGISNFKEYISNIDFSFDSLSKVKDNIYDTLSNAFSSAFESLKTFVFGESDTAFNTISDHISESYSTMGSGKEMVNNTVLETLAKKLPTIKTVISETIDILQKLYPKLKEAITNLDINKLGSGFALGGVLFTINNVSDNLMVLGKTIQGITNPLTGLVTSVQTLSKAFSKRVNRKGVLYLAEAIGILSLSVIALGRMKFVDFMQGIGGLITLTIIIGVLSVKVMPKLADTLNQMPKMDKQIDEFGKMILRLSSSFILIAIFAKIVGGMKNEQLLRAGVVAAAITILFYALSVAMNKAGEIKGDPGSAILKISVAMLLMVKIVEYASKVELTNVKQAAAIIGGITVAIAAIIAASYLAGEYSSNAGSAILKISVAMLLMVKIVEYASKVELGSVIQAIAIIGGMVYLISFIIGLSIIAGEYSSNAGSAILKISIAMLLMVKIVEYASNVELKNVNQGLKIILSIGAMFVALIAVSALAGRNAAKAGAMLVLMSIAISALVACMAVMQFIDPETIKTATLSLMGIMGMFVLLIAVSGLAKDANKTVGFMSAMILSLVGGLIALTFVDPTDLKRSVIAVSTIMGLMILMLSLFAIISKVGNNASSGSNGIKTLTISLVGMTVLIAELAGVLYLLKDIDPKSSISNAVALGVMLLALTVSVRVLSKLRDIDWKSLLEVEIGMAGLATIALLTAYVCKQFEKVEWSAMAKAGVALAGLIASILVLSFIGPAAGPVLLAVGAAMIMLSSSLLILVLAIEKLVPIMPQVATAIVLAATAFVTFITIVTQGLISLIPIVVEGITTLIAAIMDSAITLIPKLVTLLTTLVSTLLSVGTTLIPAFVTFVSKVVTSLILAAKRIIPALVGLLTQLASSLLAAGTALIPAFVTFVTTLISSLLTAATTLVPEFITLVTTTLLALLAAGRAVMPEFVNLIGDTIIAILNKLKELIPEVCALLVVLVTAVCKTIVAVTPVLVETVGDVIVAIITGIGEKIPDIIQAGWDLIINFIDGIAAGIDNNMGELGAAIGRLCKAILDGFKEFFGIHSPSTVMAEQGKYLTEGLKEGIDNNKDNPVASIKELGKNISDSMKENEDQYVENGESIPDKISEGMDNNSDAPTVKMEEIGDSIREKASAVGSGLFDTGTDFMDSITEGMGSEESGLTNNFDDILGGLGDTMDDSSGDFKKSAGGLLDSVKEGFGEKAESVKNTTGEIMEGAVDKIKSFTDRFRTTGGDVMNGFILGLRDKMDALQETSTSIGSTVENAVRKRLDVHSPSRVMKNIGRFTVEGFVIGIESYSDKAIKTVETMSEGAIDVISNALSNIDVEDDINLEPTIRPVLDTSSIESGAKSIDGLLNGNPAISLLSNVGVIGNRINNQNRGNEEVVSAINKLNNKLDNVGGTTNVINGITYDDGSNITDAVQTLIRAARMERRV